MERERPGEPAEPGPDDDPIEIIFPADPDDDDDFVEDDPEKADDGESFGAIMPSRTS